jgi:DNA-binding FadR family transcriptional regulator
MEHSIKRLERPEPFYRIVQESIKNYILDNNLLPGAPLPPETELARQLGVSRSSVREAAKALESVGILETRHGSGLFVRPFSFDPLLENLPYGMVSDLSELDDLLQIREGLESGMIDQAVKTMPKEQFKVLDNLILNMRLKAEAGESFPEEDRAFHRALFEHLDNRLLIKLLDIFWQTFHKVSKGANLPKYEVMQTYQDHAAIVEALKSGDVSRTRLELKNHYHGIENRVAQAKQSGQAKATYKHKEVS